MRRLNSRKTPQMAGPILAACRLIRLSFYAKEELKYRRVELPKPDSDESVEDSDAAPPESEIAVDPYTTCSGCGGKLRYGTLVAEKELTVVFADNREERFVRVAACIQCRQLWPTVDFDTVVDR